MTFSIPYFLDINFLSIILFHGIYRVKQKRFMDNETRSRGQD